MKLEKLKVLKSINKYGKIDIIKEFVRRLLMKKYMSVVLILCAVIIVGGCTGLGGVGSGNVINETRTVSGFSEVSLSGIGTLIIIQGDQESLIIEADDNVLPFIKTDVNNNKLEISYDTGMPAPTEEIKIYLTLQDISSVEIKGTGKVESDQLNADSLNVNIEGAGKADLKNLTVNELVSNISGAGHIILSGSTDSQKITINGAGDYQAEDLQSLTAEVNINGAGNVIIAVSEFLKAVISGTGKVEYIGNPELDQQISGAGTIAKKTD